MSKHNDSDKHYIHTKIRLLDIFISHCWMTVVPISEHIWEPHGLFPSSCSCFCSSFHFIIFLSFFFVCLFCFVFKLTLEPEGVSTFWFDLGFLFFLWFSSSSFPSQGSGHQQTGDIFANVIIIIVVIIVISFKCAIWDFLQSPHCAANHLQHVWRGWLSLIVKSDRVQIIFNFSFILFAEPIPQNVTIHHTTVVLMEESYGRNEVEQPSKPESVCKQRRTTDRKAKEIGKGNLKLSIRDCKTIDEPVSVGVNLPQDPLHCSGFFSFCKLLLVYQSILFYPILFYSRLCPSTAGSSCLPESSNCLCPLLSLSIPLPVAPVVPSLGNEPVTDIVQYVADMKWKWAGHITWMKGDRWTVRSTERQVKGVRSVGKTKHRWPTQSPASFTRHRPVFQITRSVCRDR